MLIVLAFRQVFFSKQPDHLERLQRYLLLLKQSYPLVLPGEPVKKLSLMITFDHASADFYSHVFPFLKAHNIPAVVGIAWRYVADTSALSLPLAHRLAPSETLAFQDEVFAYHQPFCSQQELKTLAETPCIQLASSGFAIRNLQYSPPYLATEIFLSKYSIEKALGKKPLGFFYPFGKYDHVCERVVKKYYPFSFVLGDTINRKNKQHGIYRLDMTRAAYVLPKFILSPQYIKNWLMDRCRQTYLRWRPYSRERINFQESSSK
ncbi:xylanase/chitin deacetilase [Chlamydia felis Fe/C-56]|uniref:Xylanase/chitin deacetilase n=1 Tax=Chlamydia felis (strain Fe/C-56) TaxID=264202 RepID=Q252R6_CHLFF|nr:polysaccharide deacetylase family protein [Chlamydia felis]BAE81722.1 xylanase/chitin deacetilase [Chlamydia felis Fe/C-56]